MTLHSKIIFQSRKTIYIQINYTGLSKGRSFIMIKIYPTASNAILNSIIPKIAILVNFIKKTLKIDKSIYIAIIHKYADTIYLMVGSPGVLVVLTVILTTISKLLSLI